METITQTAQAQQVLDKVKETYGFVPNLFTEFADHSPAVADVYLTAMKLIGEASLSPKEQQAVILAISSYNDCAYCKAAHGTVAGMVGIPKEEIEAITAGDLPSDSRLRSLITVARRILEKRGWLSADDLAEFEAQDIDRGQIYEIVALIGIKTISNFVNHIADTEIDPQFR
ncbi:MAG: carboxymuconolactone decarboxylase family protein [Bacteroidetes bacterium]|nr:carboxymuconolactone decarboxylase family protein [Bacteroidota bacterium]